MTGIRPFDGIDEYAMCYQIALGLNPLDYALENSPKRKLKVLSDNPELVIILRDCFDNDHA